MRFQAGDKVRLKVGGPAMVVEERDPDTKRLKCIWFDKTEKMMSSMFDDASLEPVHDDVAPEPPDYID